MSGEAATRVRAVVQAAQEAQSDVEALMALHTEDAVIVNLAGRRVRGRREFEEVMRAALTASLADVRTTVEVEHVAFPAEGTAVVSCRKQVHDERIDADGDVPASGALTYVLVDGPEGWRIALAQTTPVSSA